MNVPPQPAQINITPAETQIPSHAQFVGIASISPLAPVSDLGLEVIEKIHERVVAIALEPKGRRATLFVAADQGSRISLHRSGGIT